MSRRSSRYKQRSASAARDTSGVRMRPLRAIADVTSPHLRAPHLAGTKAVIRYVREHPCRRQSSPHALLRLARYQARGTAPGPGSTFIGPLPRWSLVGWAGDPHFHRIRTCQSPRLAARHVIAETERLLVRPTVAGRRWPGCVTMRSCRCWPGSSCTETAACGSTTSAGGQRGSKCGRADRLSGFPCRLRLGRRLPPSRLADGLCPVPGTGDLRNRAAARGGPRDHGPCL